MKFAIILSTYQRNDGRTPVLIKRTLNSILNQTHTDYKIFLIGDRYENNDEFEQICNDFVEKEKIYYENLDSAVERDFFKNKLDVWKFGGVNACNYAIDLAVKEGLRYIVKIDHDDFWEESHLKTINDCIESTSCAFVCTKSLYRNSVLPNINSDIKYINFLPQPETLVHSSICIDLLQIPIRYRTLGDEKCGNQCADGCLYLEISEIVNNNNLKSILINEITCTVESDGFFKNN